MSITKQEIAKHAIESGREFPYDAPDGWTRGQPTPPEIDYAHAAARGILTDLCDRSGIKHGFADIDEEIRKDIIESIAEIIRQAKEEDKLDQK